MKTLETELCVIAAGPAGLAAAIAAAELGTKVLVLEKHHYRWYCQHGYGTSRC